MWMNVHNGPNLETTQMTILWWTDKQIVVYAYNLVLPSNQQELTLDIGNDINASLKYDTKFKKSDIKGAC